MKRLFTLIVLTLSASFLFSQTFTSSPASAIPDNNCDVTNEFTQDLSAEAMANLDGTTLGIQSVEINITHGWASDLEVFLVAPDATEVELTTDNGGSGDNYIGTVFTCDAATDITSGSAPFTGSFLPEGDLTTINNGQSPNGLWTLRVCDDASGDAGTLDSWTLVFAPNSCVPPTCPDPTSFSIENVTDVQADFSWTPGPSSISFVLEVCPDGVLAGDPTCITESIGVLGGPIGVVNLTPETAYDAYLTEDCGAGGASNTVGPLEFTTPASPPENDACSGAIPVADGASFSASNTSATNVEGLTACSGGSGVYSSCPTTVNDGTIDFGAGIWYVYTSTGAESITIETTGFDTEIQVFSGACASLVCVVGDDDSYSGGCCGSQVCFESAASFAPVDYYIYVDGHGSNTGTFDFTLNTSPILPIEILSFTAKAEKEGNKVEWSTATEINSDYQLVQRSLDGKNNWTDVEQVQSRGNSFERVDYEVMDKEPYQTTYYRIKAVDFDGTYDYSEVVSVVRENRSSENINIVPNPTKGQITLESNLASDGSYTISVVDMAGKVLDQVTTFGNAGLNVYQYDLSELQSGVYMISVSTSTERFVKRVVKQ